MSFGPDGKECEDDGTRKAGDRKKLIEVLEAWREEVHGSDPIGFLFDAQDVIEDDGIELVARIQPSRLYKDGPKAITNVLDETCEWGSFYARRMFERIWRHDHGPIEMPMYE